jgi:AcrR family transcriptional regulator
VTEETMQEVAGLLEDDVAREVLAATSVEAMSASDLAERCDVSEPTIYRRLESLRDAELVAQGQELDPDGDHYTVYRARFQRLRVELERGDYDVEVTLLEDPADRFTRLFEEIG